SYQIKIRSNYRNDDFPVILYIGSWAFKVLKYQLLLLLKPMYYIVIDKEREKLDYSFDKKNELFLVEDYSEHRIDELLANELKSMYGSKVTTVLIVLMRDCLVTRYFKKGLGFTEKIQAYIQGQMLKRTMNSSQE
ncbi:hypothetical protein DERF_011858, partial [Dermatophagoides farinae]